MRRSIFTEANVRLEQASTSPRSESPTGVKSSSASSRSGSPFKTPGLPASKLSTQTPVTASNRRTSSPAHHHHQHKRLLVPVLPSEQVYHPLLLLVEHPHSPNQIHCDYVVRQLGFHQLVHPSSLRLQKYPQNALLNDHQRNPNPVPQKNPTLVIPQ